MGHSRVIEKLFGTPRKAEEWMVLPIYKSCVNDILFSGIPLFIKISYIALRDIVSKHVLKIKTPTFQ